MGKIELYVASLDNVKNCMSFWMHVIVSSHIHFPSSSYIRYLNLATSLQKL